MGVFGAFFACIGVTGFNACCSRASIGDRGFALACISGCRGVVGFTVPPQCILRAKKFALRGLVVGVSAKKFALRAHNGPKLVFSGVLGELFRGWGVKGGVLGELFRACRPATATGRGPPLLPVLWPGLAGPPAPSTSVTMGLLRYTKPSSAVSPACRSLM